METAMRMRLRTDSTVAAITAQVDWGVRPQGSALPAIVLTNIADQRDQHFLGNAAFRLTRVQVDCYAQTRAKAAALREAVIAALVPEATVGGVTFLRSFVNTVLDRGDQTETGFIHREMIDLNIWRSA